MLDIWCLLVVAVDNYKLLSTLLDHFPVEKTVAKALRYYSYLDCFKHYGTLLVYKEVTLVRMKTLMVNSCLCVSEKCFMR